MAAREEATSWRWKCPPDGLGQVSCFALENPTTPGKGKKMKEFHPIAAKYDLLDGEEYAAFKADIAVNKQQIPILLFEDKVLDGRNRERVLDELGIEPVYKIFEGTAEEAAVVADSLNLQRRHLTPEQKRKVIAIKLKQDPERSDRAIAEEVGADHKTVASVREEKESTGDIPQLTKRKGKDGKTRKKKTSQKKQSKKRMTKEIAKPTEMSGTPEPETPANSASPATAAETRDQLTVEEMEGARRDLGCEDLHYRIPADFGRELKAACKRQGVDWKAFVWSAIRSHFEVAKVVKDETTKFFQDNEGKIITCDQIYNKVLVHGNFDLMCGGHFFVEQEVNYLVNNPPEGYDLKKYKKANGYSLVKKKQGKRAKAA
jgi:hypothetical protein